MGPKTQPRIRDALGPPLLLVGEEHHPGAARTWRRRRGRDHATTEPARGLEWRWRTQSGRPQGVSGGGDLSALHQVAQSRRGGRFRSGQRRAAQPHRRLSAQRGTHAGHRAVFDQSQRRRRRDRTHDVLASRCNGCHNNAGANVAEGFNRNFSTGVETVRVAELDVLGIPSDGGFGGGAPGAPFDFDADGTLMF
jgi:hypothetical protein